MRLLGGLGPKRAANRSSYSAGENGAEVSANMMDRDHRAWWDPE